MKPKIESDRSSKKPFPMREGVASESRPRAPALRSRMDALASLLVDDDARVHTEIRRAIEDAGEASRPALERASRSDDPRLRARARAILADRARERALRRFARYAFRSDVDLERGLFLLARVHAPRLDPRPYQRALDAMAAEVARRGANEPDGMARALALVAHLGKELRFGGSRGEFHHPDNIDVQRVIERRAGIPLALSAIWLFVARRAGIQGALLPLPGHVMLRLHAGRRSVIVDPYHDGRIRTEEECRAYLVKHGVAANGPAFRDAPDSVLLRRQVANMARSAELRGRPREAKSLVALVRALEPRRRSGSLPA